MINQDTALVLFLYLAFVQGLGVIYSVWEKTRETWLAGLSNEQSEILFKKSFASLTDLRVVPQWQSIILSHLLHIG